MTSTTVQAGTPTTATNGSPDPVANEDPTTNAGRRGRFPPDEGRQSFTISWIGWDNYVLISDGVGENPVRVTYDGKAVELMSLSEPHEIWKAILNRIIEALADELKVRLFNYGSFTNRSQTADRGIEPDICFYRTRTPGGSHATGAYVPPDLVVEIEISRSMLDRIAICAALGIPEIWRFDSERLTVMTLGVDGGYSITTESRVFPTVPLSDLSEFICGQYDLSVAETRDSLRTWLRTKGLRAAGDD